MIYSVRGKLTHKEPFLAVVECAGAELHVQLLHSWGKPVKKYICIHICMSEKTMWSFLDFIQCRS